MRKCDARNCCRRKNQLKPKRKSRSGLHAKTCAGLQGQTSPQAPLDASCNPMTIQSGNSAHNVPSCYLLPAPVSSGLVVSRPNHRIRADATLARFAARHFCLMVRTQRWIRPQRCPGILAAPAAETALFLGFIAPLHGCSDVKRNVTVACSCRRQQPSLRSACPECLSRSVARTGPDLTSPQR